MSVNKEKTINLIQLFFHSWYQHDTSNTYSNEQEECVDQPGDCGVVPTGAASAQQTGSTATQTWDLGKNGIPISISSDDTTETCSRNGKKGKLNYQGVNTESHTYYLQTTEYLVLMGKD